MVGGVIIANINHNFTNKFVINTISMTMYQSSSTVDTAFHVVILESVINGMVPLHGLSMLCSVHKNSVQKIHEHLLEKFKNSNAECFYQFKSNIQYLLFEMSFEIFQRITKVKYGGIWQGKTLICFL